jgi:hypothetical protein
MKCNESFYPTIKELDEVKVDKNTTSFICSKCRNDSVLSIIRWKIIRKLRNIKSKIWHFKRKIEMRNSTHNCFNHDYDGGVCLVCGTNTSDLYSQLGIYEGDYF